MATHVIVRHEAKTLDTADSLREVVMEKGGPQGFIFSIIVIVVACTGGEVVVISIAVIIIVVVEEGVLSNSKIYVVAGYGIRSYF